MRLHSRMLTRQFFFFNDTATTEIYTLSLHDALPISHTHTHTMRDTHTHTPGAARRRSEEHTSELQSHLNLVCRLLLGKNTARRILGSNTARMTNSRGVTEIGTTR